MAALGDYLCAMTKIRLLLLATVCAALLPASAGLAAKKPEQKPAHAAPSVDPGPAKSLGSTGSWTAYLAQNKAGKVCYLVGKPAKVDPAVKRKPAMAMVTHRTEDNVSNVVSFDEGYPLDEDDDVTIEIGPNRYTLFAHDDTAWARTSELDKTIVAAMAKEKQVEVKTTPKKGRGTVDVYSLSGFSKVLSLIDKACGVRR
jgi:Invasion associated locus B (IalB) protein